MNLKYIIIGRLPEREQEYLKKNIENEQMKAGYRDGCVEILFLEGMNAEDLEEIAGKSIFISDSGAELRQADALGMATLGYLPPEGEDGISADMYAEGFEEIGVTFLQHVFERHHGIPWTIFATERCVVREFSMEYLDELFELYAGEGMTDYIEPLYPYEQEREYQQAYIKHMYGFYGYGMWIVCDRNTGKLIGRAGVEHREELGGELELGYAIGVPYQRQGYATEVCRAILRYVREELEVPRIHCLIEEGNHVSEHFAEKLGFLREGSMEIGGKCMQRYVYTF